MACRVGNHPGGALVQTMREHGHDLQSEIEGGAEVSIGSWLAIGLSLTASLPGRRAPVVAACEGRLRRPGRGLKTTKSSRHSLAPHTKSQDIVG